MIDRDEARARVLEVIAEEFTALSHFSHSAIAQKIMQALYAPRTRLREVVAPSGSVYRVSAGVLDVRVNGTGYIPTLWNQCGSVPPQDCAVVADLLARPTEAVPSEESVVTADALDAKRYRAWRALTLSAAPKQTPQQLDEAVDEMVAQQGAPS